MKNTDIESNNALKNIIAPMGLNFTKNDLTIGENEAKVYGVMSYPQTANFGWLSQITNIPNTYVSIGVEPIDSLELISSLDKNIKADKERAETVKNESEKRRAINAIKNAEETIDRIDQSNETLVLMDMQVMAVAPDDKELKFISKRVETTINAKKCKTRVLKNLQKEGFKSISPMFKNEKIIDVMTQKPMPISTFAGGFPFASTSFSDGYGAYFARDKDGGLILVDLWKRSGDRTNSNMIFLGDSGGGKSTAVKHLALNQIMQGDRFIFIDPEGEYIHLTISLGGDVIKAGGSTSTKLNPLQVRVLPADEDDEDYDEDSIKDSVPDLVVHLNFLEVFFKLYLQDLKQEDISELKRLLLGLYNKFNINWDTDINKLKNTDYPIFQDFYDFIDEKIKNNDETEDIDFLKKLKKLLFGCVFGTESFMWNGHTTVDSKAKVKCYDTTALQNSSDNIKSAQYYNIFSLSWQDMSYDRKERVILACDEAYLMIDEHVPQSMVALRNAEKRARKYEAALWIISQASSDFLSPSIKQYGEALFTIPTYKLFFGADSEALNDLKKLFKFSEEELKLLESKSRGKALAVFGSKRLQVNFKIPKYKFEYFGSKGGR